MSFVEYTLVQGVDQAPAMEGWLGVPVPGLDTLHQTAMLRQTKRQDRSVLSAHGALQIGAVIALVADYLVWLDRTQIWVQNSLNKNGSNVADLYAALHRRMRTTAAGPQHPPTTNCISMPSVCL